jgi:hypothetical protein
LSAGAFPPLTGLPVKGGGGDWAVSDKTSGNQYNTEYLKSQGLH